MTASLFERTLARPAMLDVFADAALVEAMLAFESALAEAEAAAGAIPASAVGGDRGRVRVDASTSRRSSPKRARPAASPFRSSSG